MVVAAEFGQWMALSAYYVNAVSVRQSVGARPSAGPRERNDALHGRRDASRSVRCSAARLGGADRSAADAGRRLGRHAPRVPVALALAGARPPRPGVSFSPSASPGDAAFGRPVFERGFGRRARAPRFDGLPPIPGWLAVHVLRDRAGALAHAHHRLRLGKTPWLAVQRAAARALDRTIYPT